MSKKPWEEDYSESTESPPWKNAYDKASDKPSKTESGIRGGLQGATFGLSDEIVGGGGAAWKALQGDFNFSDNYSKSRDEDRAANKLAEDTNPGTYMTGEIGAGIASTFIPGIGLVGNLGKGAMLAKGAGVGAKIVNSGVQLGIGGAASGALTGLGKGQGSLENQAKDTGEGALLGGAVGGLLGGGTQALVQGGKALYKGTKDKLANHLFKNNPNAEDFVNNPELIDQANNATITNQRTQGLINTAKDQEPGMYNKITDDITGYQDKAYDYNQSQYGAMHKDAARNTGIYNQERNTPGTMLEAIDDAFKELPDSIPKDVNGVLQASPVDDDVVGFIREVKLSLPKDLTASGKMVKVTNSDGSTSNVIEALTPEESFKRAFELTRMVKNTYTSAVGKLESPTPDKIARLREVADKITDTFDNNLIGDIDTNTLNLYKEATETNAINRQLNKSQSKLSAKEDSATGFERANPINADKLKSFNNQIDEGSRANIKSSIAGQQDMLGLPRRDLFSEIEASRANVAKLEQEIAAQNLNSSKWSSLGGGGETVADKGFLRGIPFAGDTLANLASPQTRIKLLNTLKEERPKLASWITGIVNAGRPVNVALVRSIATQSRERTEDVAKTLEDLGVKIEK